jgi:hypothetical protein
MRREWSRAIGRACLVCGLGFLWMWLFWFQPARDFPVVGGLVRGVDRAFAQIPIEGIFAWVFRSYVLVLVPVAVVLATGQRPTALGLGGVARYGWRVIAVGFVVSLPVLMWLGLRPGMHAYYANILGGGDWRAAVATAAVIVVEHAWIFGVVLALALPGRGFPVGDDPPRRGALAFLGFGFPADLGVRERSPWLWLGVPPLVMPCLVLQALAFGAVHAGKEFGELVTAFPGGLGLGILTYRIRSFWPSVVLHLGCGGIILLTMYLSR